MSAPPRSAGVHTALWTLVLFALCLLASGQADARVLTSPWQTSFARGFDGADFNHPHSRDAGGCDRSVRDGAAWYTHRYSGGGPTRCYPAQVFDPDYMSGLVSRGRFYVDVSAGEITTNSFFSLATFKLIGGDYWNTILTLNLTVDSGGPTAGKPRLYLYHVPYQGTGQQERVRGIPFPMRQWVDVVVHMSPSGEVTVHQDGQLVLRATKRDTSGTVYGAHWGGYASADVTGWTVGNDDLYLAPYGASVPSAPIPAVGAPATPAPPAAPAPAAPAPEAASSRSPRAGRRLAPMWLRGGAGRDRLIGGPRDDRLLGRARGDVLIGRGGLDTLQGGLGDDRLSGGSGGDRVFGGPGRDRLYGGPGRDLLDGGPGRDLLKGGAGNDTLRAVDGHDDLVLCGPGRDRVEADRSDLVADDCEIVRRV